jgi:hypothetical protein
VEFELSLLTDVTAGSWLAAQNSNPAIPPPQSKITPPNISNTQTHALEDLFGCTEWG